jgi:glycine hydroxymethyltransferase
MRMKELEAADRELLDCLQGECLRQKHGLEMIASESMQPRMALEIAGGVFNNKTAVGNPGNQRLQGSQYADQLERLAAARACTIFGAEHTNMTPYSGTVANFCAYGAVLTPGDTVLAMDPVTGAHQSHGGSKNISSKLYDFHFFGLDPKTLDIDYAEAEKKARELSPKLMVIGSAAYPRKIDYARLAEIAHSNGALLMADIAHFSGLIAAGLSPNPLPHADIVTASTTKTMCGPHSGFVMCRRELADRVDKGVYPGFVASLHLQTIAAMAYALGRSQTAEFKALMARVLSNAQALCEALKKKGFSIFTDGTDCHMFLLELHGFGIDGVQFSALLEELGITVNSKGIPFDPSTVAMGVRMGTTVLSQRGMGEAEMEEIAQILYLAATNPKNGAVLCDLKARVRDLTERFPIPTEYNIHEV